MSNHHYEKWILKAPLGFLLISGGVFFIYYSLTQLTADLKDRWVYYGLVSALLIGAGAVILCTAFIHKMKSDLIKKTKIRNESQ